MTSTHIRFDDDDFEYEPSDSENEYTQEEKDLIEGALNENEESDDEVAVYGVGGETSSDDNSEIALSDVEGQGDEDDLPDVRAWGKDKRKFYSTDYVDPDYGGFQGTDAIQADFEEEEARNLQKQLMNEMDEDDFAFDFVEKDTKPEEKQPEELIKTDVSKLSKRQRIELLHKESPEFFGLVEDFKKKMAISKEYLLPTIVLWKESKINESNALLFVRTYQEIISNYCSNINMYLLLKASRINVQNHPIIKRLFQYRKLLSQLDPIFEKIIQKQVENLLQSNKNTPVERNTKKVLKVLKKSTKKEKGSAQKPPKTKLEKEQKLPVTEVAVVREEEADEPTEGEDGLEKEEDGDERRAITYQIAKNKGLTPHRNKLQRNPRVKHRNKYRKALIRRKGAVRTVRTEVTRYGGELSGIKATVSKSIKIKS